jgi:lipoprotein signal peptidase
MGGLIVAFVAVPLVDLVVKRLLRLLRTPRSIRLAPFASLQIVFARIWLTRLRGNLNTATLWTIWALAAVALVTASAWLPASRWFVGLALGGSFTNALDSARHGSVIDYIRVGSWPVFNVADLALTSGVAGVAVEFLLAVSRMA